MKKKLVMLLCGAMMATSIFAACGSKEEASPAPAASAEASGEAVMSDQEAADHVAELIDAIYVQQRTADTDAQCKAAKEAWDALTDAQKELVEGEEADPDYFGRDTGDASLDDPRNQDGIGENEILVVSFGTSFNDSRVQDIKGIEDAIAEAYPDYSVRRAFTAQIIINHVQARDEEFIDNMDQALQRAVDNGVKNLILQPTHLMHGAEYDEMVAAAMEYADKFESLIVSEPMLGQVGANGSDVNEDKKEIAKAVIYAALDESGYESTDAATEDGVAYVLMGHGTSHSAKITYTQMQSQMQNLSFNNVYVGTVEGEPEETECGYIIDELKEAGYTKVILRPLMVVAGDHANNDMAGDEEDSWKSLMQAAGFDVDCQIAGLGRIDAVKDIYVAHLADAIENGENLATASSANAVAAGALEDGEYEAYFTTDSTMFHVNEANDGKGVLTVKNGKMTIHVSLAGSSIVNLYLGTVEQAEKAAESDLLVPTVDTVTYSDGETDEVNGFDIPVENLDQDFDCALLGKKGKWYDHKVSVSLVK